MLKSFLFKCVVFMFLIATMINMTWACQLYAVAIDESPPQQCCCESSIQAEQVLEVYGDYNTISITNNYQNDANIIVDIFLTVVIEELVRNLIVNPIIKKSKPPSKKQTPICKSEFKDNKSICKGRKNKRRKNKRRKNKGRNNKNK